VNVKFSKSVSVEKMIRSKTIEGLRLEHEAWLEKVQTIKLFSEEMKTQIITEETRECESGEYLEQDMVIEQKIVQNNKSEELKIEEHSYYKSGGSQRWIVLLLILIIVILMSFLAVMYKKVQGLETRIMSLENPGIRVHLDSEDDMKWADDWLKI